MQERARGAGVVFPGNNRSTFVSPYILPLCFPLEREFDIAPPSFLVPTLPILIILVAIPFQLLPRLDRDEIFNPSLVKLLFCDYKKEIPFL